MARATDPSRSEESVKAHIFGFIETKGISSKNAKTFFRGRISTALNTFSRILAFTSARVYALSALSFGLLTLFLHLADYYFRSDPHVELSTLIIGAAFAALSIPLFLSDKPICMALQSFKLTDFVIFEFFSVNRMQSVEHQGKGLPPIAGVILGALPAVAGYFTSVPVAVIAVASLIFCGIAMASPELPYIFSLLIFPFLPLIPYSSLILCALVGITLLSFGRKVILGKRVYAFEIYDILVVLAVFAVIITGVILGGSNSTPIALYTAVFVLSYIPAANIAVNRRLCDCVASAIVVASVPVSIFAIIDGIVNLSTGNGLCAKGWFASPELLCVYLTVASLFSLTLSVERKKPANRILYSLSFYVSFLAIILTGYFAFIIALLIGILSFMIIRSSGVPKILLIFSLALPFAVFLLPASVLSAISDALSISPTLNEVYSSVLSSAQLFGDNLFGIGANGYEAGEYPMFNTYFGIFCRFGIGVMVITVLFLLLRLRHHTLYGRFFQSSVVGFYVNASSLAVILMLVYGTYTDIFSDVNNVYFFISLLAMGAATLRISRKEREDRLSYYKDLRSFDSSVIDVTIVN